MKRAVENLPQLFRRHCEQHALIEPGDRLLLAISGGADSRVMLDLLHHLQAEWRLSLAVGHVHHLLRGTEADEDAAFVEALAAHDHMPFFLKRVEVKKHAHAQSLSLETAGRELRYRALDEMSREFGASAVVTAHNRDDQVETIFAHFLRGSGLGGLRGIPVRSVLPSCKTPLLRPLLNFSRGQILAYARARDLVWREDSSNTNRDIFRNRLRHELLPLLTDRFNPSLHQSVLRLSAIAAEADEYFQRAAEEALEKVAKERGRGKIVLDLQQFWKYFSLIQAYLVRLVVQQVMNSGCRLTFAETDRILSLLRSTHHHHPASTGRRYLWRKRVEIIRDEAGVIFRTFRPAPSEHPLEVGKRCSIPEAGISITIDHDTGTTDWRMRVHERSQFIDADCITGRLSLRFPRPGDRFRPLGMAGSKKLSDFFIDMKIPWSERADVPLVTCERDLIWVCGYRLDERFKITANTTRRLHLEIEDLRTGGA